MILVCVGASEYSFERLLISIDELCDEGNIYGRDIIAQIGSSKYVPINYKSFSLIGRNDFQKYMESADIVITHAGTGSVIPSLKLGKKVIVFPRREEYGEHLDNHQLELANVLTSSGYTLCATNKKELKECILNIKNFTPKKFVSNKERMNELIIEYIDKL